MPQHRILVVDDSPNILKALRRTFALEGLETVCASSAAEAIGVLANQEIDVIISDENMPGCVGSDLLEQVRDLYPGVIRMMLTGETDIDVAMRAINQGAIHRFFTKPWDDHELLVAVMHALKMKELETENRQLKSSVKKQERLLKELENEYPDIADRRQAEDGAFIID